MTETITYSCLIILLPIIPSLILYIAIPTQENEVEGQYQGLNIKLTGAFGSYFLLVIMLLGFITTRVVTEHKFEYWTVEGRIIKDGIEDPRQVTFSIQPPIRQVTTDGRFVIEDVPISKGEIKRSTLNIQIVTNGQKRSQVVHLERSSFVPFSTHKLEFDGNHVSIITPIALELASSSNPQNQAAGSYDPTNAQDVNRGQ